MVKLIMIAENHKSPKIGQIGSIISSHASVKNSPKLVLVEGPILSEREHKILKGKMQPKTEAESLLMGVDAFVYKTMKLGPSSSFLNDMGAEIQGYRQERKLGEDCIIKPLEPAVFLTLPIPGFRHDKIEDIIGSKGENLYGHYNQFLHTFSSIVPSENGLESKVIFEIRKVYSSIVDTIERINALPQDGFAGIFAEFSKFIKMISLILKLRKFQLNFIQLRSAIHMDTILSEIGRGKEEIFTISGYKHVIQLFSSPKIPNHESFISTEKEVILITEKINNKERRSLSANAKVTEI